MPGGNGGTGRPPDIPEILPPIGGNGRSKSSSVNVRVWLHPNRITIGKPGKRPSSTLAIST